MVCTRSSTKSRESGKGDDRQEGLSGEAETPTQQVPLGSLSHQPPDSPSPSKDDPSASTRNRSPDVATKGEANLNDELTLQAVIDRACLKQYALMEPLRGATADIMAESLCAYAMAVKSPGVSAGLDDCYGGLCDVISNMSNHFTTTWEQLSLEEQKRLKSWAPNAEHLFKSHCGRSAVFEAWVWHILDDNIFSAEPSRKWQGMEDKMAIWNLFGQSMSILQKFDTSEGGPGSQGYNKNVKYHLWRSLFAELAGLSARVIGTLPKGHLHKVVMGELGHLIDWPHSDIDMDLLQECSEGLDYCLMVSRAKHKLRWHPIGFPFTESLDDQAGMPPMTLFELEQAGDWRAAEYEGMPVEVVMRPAIEVWGCEVFQYDTALGNRHWWKKPMVVAVGGLPAEDAGESLAGAGEASGIADEAA